MIFYFTGTGNSGYIAKELGNIIDEDVLSISNLMKNKEALSFEIGKDERIGFVFPVYAWGPPKMVEDFIRKAEFKFSENPYVYSVATCGANIGNTMSIMGRCLKEKNLKLASGFSIIMPNNYTIMGDVDSKKDEDKKLLKSKDEVVKIGEVIKNKEEGVFKVTKGFMGALLTSIVHPMFIKNAMDTSKFYVTDACISCGRCERVCTASTIKIVDKKPVWNTDCNQCLACYHSCPVNAIQYGKGTKGKGQYINPYFKI